MFFTERQRVIAGLERLRREGSELDSELQCAITILAAMTPREFSTILERARRIPVNQTIERLYTEGISNDGNLTDPGHPA